MNERHPEIPILGVLGPIPGVLVTHDATECALPFCCIHHPSEHPLASAPLRWRNDLQVMERVCVHGLGHPDPDSLDYVNAICGEMAAAYACVHFPCDGCCGSVPPGGVFVDG